MKRLVTIFFSLILLMPIFALAELPEQVERDFATVSGTVVTPINDEYIIDLDGRDNLYVGDVLTLVEPGKKLFHPETGALLGVVDIPIGFLRVTRINSGYSYAKVITEGVELKSGATIKRFEQVPALFVDDAGEGAVARQLQTDLPQFEWLAEDQQERALLTFVLKPGVLDVKTAQGTYLHSYAITSEDRIKAPPAPVRRPFVETAAKPEPKLLQKVANSVLGMVNLADDEALSGRNIGVIQQRFGGQKGVWMGPNISGNPVGVAVADLDGDGQQETAIAMNNKLVIARITDGKYVQLKEVEIPSRLNAFSLDVIDLDQSGRPELYLTAVGAFQPASLVVEYTGSDYDIVIDDVRWFLRVIEMPERGRVLIGQNMGNDVRTFTGEPFYIKREGGRLVRGDSFELPGLANIFSFMPFHDRENQLLFAHLTKDDHLKVITQDGDDLWESEAYFGGSESCFDNREEPLGNIGNMVISTCIRPRILKTAAGELLVVQNDGQRIMQRYRKFGRSRLVSLSWNGFALAENWRTADQQGYLGDFTIADADNDGQVEMVMGVKFQHAGFTDEARSTIVTFEMQ